MTDRNDTEILRALKSIDNTYDEIVTNARLQAFNKSIVESSEKYNAFRRSHEVLAFRRSQLPYSYDQSPYDYDQYVSLFSLTAPILLLLELIEELDRSMGYCGAFIVQSERPEPEEMANANKRFIRTIEYREKTNKLLSELIAHLKLKPDIT